FHVVPGELVVQTADALAIDLTDKERREILSLPPATKSLAAFLAFGKGIDLEDRGMIADANEAFAEAVRLDPGFQLVRDRVAITQIGSASFQTALNRIQRVGAAASGSYGSASGDAAARAVGAIGLEVEEATLGEDDSTKRTPQASGPPIGTVRATGSWPVAGTRGGSN
ncbi:MAG: hypothetical protein HKN20_02070, partial [Gemmatimonadetes bacterium]|nr:hypothetical protein [Gemmatimonadota bacterium]